LQYNKNEEQTLEYNIPMEHDHRCNEFMNVKVIQVIKQGYVKIHKLIEEVIK